MLKLSLSLSLSQVSDKAITSNCNPKALMLSFSLLKLLAKLQQLKCIIEKLVNPSVDTAKLCLNCSSV